MKKILILVSAVNKDKEKFNKLLKERLYSDAEVRMACYSDLVFRLRENETEVALGNEDLKSFQLVYFRSTYNYRSSAKAAAVYLKASNIKFIDSAIGKGAYMGNKLVQLMHLAVNNLPIVPSVCLGDGILPESIEKLSKELKLPLVVKDLGIQKLKGVYLVNSNRDVKLLPKSRYSEEKIRYLFQRFIEIKKEYRLLCLGGKVVTAHTRLKRDLKSIKVNISDRSQKVSFVDVKQVPLGMKIIAEKGSAVLGLEIAGVDICIDKSNKFWLVEINRGPGIEYDSDYPQEISAIADYFRK